jgi:DNA-binding protein H-NS
MVARIGTRLSKMDAAELVALRAQVDRALSSRRTALKEQLAALGMDGMGTGRRGKTARRGGGSLKGVKVKPKYRSPTGETWAGRGVRPRWLVAAIKSGKKAESFLIDKAAGKKK